MYRATGAGEEPHPPALLCMVVLLQGYVGASDAEAVELSLVDLRWQMVLDCLDANRLLAGGSQAFRERMIAHEMDRVLLDGPSPSCARRDRRRRRAARCPRRCAPRSTAAL